MSEHSIFPPSGLNRLVECAGYFQMSRLFPEREDSPSSMEGVAAHWVVHRLYLDMPVTTDMLAPNGIAITEEMIEGAQMFFDEIPNRMLLPNMPIHAEEPVMIPRVHEQCWGTPDLWFYMDGELNVYDYKFGHEFVDPYENYQLMAYAVGALEQMSLRDDITRVNLKIIQPRNFDSAGPVRTWSEMGSYFRPYVNRMRAAAERALDPTKSPDLHSGSHCLHCSAIYNCPAALSSGQTAFDFTKRLAPAVMSPESKGLYLRQIKEAQAVLKAIGVSLEEDVEDSIRKGIPIPGFTLKPGQGKTVWTKPFEEVAAIGQLLGSNFQKQALITPLQAIAELKKKGIDGAVISGYTDRQSGGLKLAQIDSDFTKRIFNQGESNA